MGCVTITDAIKATSVAVKELMRQGIEVIMLTEIIKNTANVADELHLTSFIAGCLSEDKLQRNSKIASRRENCCHGG
jgi:Cu2+-exporting ATPase